jgi:3-hydroxyacyl-CoA dehydrogenase
MGSGIATALILSNIYVVLKEVNSEYLLKGIRFIEGFFFFPQKLRFTMLFSRLVCF